VIRTSAQPDPGVWLLSQNVSACPAPDPIKRWDFFNSRENGAASFLHELRNKNGAAVLTQVRPLPSRRVRALFRLT
jgi:hypothetical protein